MLTMSSKEAARYSQDGYIVRRNLLTSKEIALIRDRARAPIEAEIREGKTGGVITLTKAVEKQYGFLTRDERLVDLAQDAIGKPIYRYRHVLMPNVSAYQWHQDFAFFYADGLLAPQMATIYVPLVKATKDNGCIRVLKGSHKLGRLNHSGVDQVDQEQFEAALKRFEVVYVEMEPGDVIVFDGCLLHGSDANRTNTHLSTIHCYYNAVENVHYKKDYQYGHYEPLEKVSASTFLMTPDGAV